jgi:DNA polymerase III epsilon subunit-like protein
MRFVIFDTETTGLLPKCEDTSDLSLYPYIVQFSYVIYDSDMNKVIKIVDEIIKIPEDIIISEKCVSIHGITNEMCAKGKDIVPIIKEFILDVSLSGECICHNVSFDIKVLYVEMMRNICNMCLSSRERCNLKSDSEYLLKSKKYCTLKSGINVCNIKMYNRYGKMYLKYPRLIELHKSLFNESVNGVHNSLNDVLITLRCFMKLKYDIDLKTENESYKALLKLRKII